MRLSRLRVLAATVMLRSACTRLSALTLRARFLALTGRKHSDEIEPMREYWETVATDVLDAIRPATKDPRTTFQVAKYILEWELSDPRGGKHGAKGENVLDLATRLQAKKFISHRYCQLIMMHSWAGQLDDPSVLLRLEDDTTPNWRIVLRAALPFHFMEDLLGTAKVVPNWPRSTDGENGNGNGEHFAAGSQEPIQPSGVDGDGRADDNARAVMPAWFHVYSIPAIKFWARTTFTHGGIAMLFSALLLGTSITQPHGLSMRPGPIQATLEIAFAVWVLGAAADYVETWPARHAWARTGLRPAWAYVDSVSLSCQLIVVCLRMCYIAAGETFLAAARRAGEEGVGAYGWFTADELDSASAAAAPGYGRQDPMTGWLFPIALSITSLSCFLRFVIETLLVFPRLGVLAICTREMLANNLVQWGVMMVVVLFAFGLGFSALAPDYPLDAATRGCYLADVDDIWRRSAFGEGYRGEPACEQRFSTGPWFISVSLAKLGLSRPQRIGCKARMLSADILVFPYLVPLSLLIYVRTPTPTPRCGLFLVISTSGR